MHVLFVIDDGNFAVCKKIVVAYTRRHFDDRTWPPNPSNTYINLAVKNDNKSWRHPISKSLDETLTDSNSFLDYRLIFKDMNHLEQRLILIEGRPGSGKTTLINKLSYDWSSGEIPGLSSHLLICVPLHKLSACSLDIYGILSAAYPGLSKDKKKMLADHLKAYEGEGVVFVLDGFDECGNTKEFVASFARGEILPYSFMVLASRPAACLHIRYYAGRQIEVLGFYKPQVREYINGYFEQDKGKAKSLLEHLRAHPNLRNMCYLPLHCSMVCYLYKDGANLPETETKFYEYFTCSTLIRSIFRQKAISCEFHLESLNEIPHGNIKNLFIKVICQYAFNQTTRHKQALYSRDGCKLFPAETTGSDETTHGLVTVDFFFQPVGVDSTYTFTHQTLQEFLAAAYIVSETQQGQLRIVEQYNAQCYLFVMWKFFCGLMDFSTDIAINMFKKLIEGTNGNTLEQVHYAYESQNSQACSVLMDTLGHMIAFTNVSLNSLDCNAVGYIVQRSGQSQCYISFEKCSFDTKAAIALLRRLSDAKVSVEFL